MKFPKRKGKGDFRDRTAGKEAAKHYPLGFAENMTESFNKRYRTAEGGQDQAHIPGNLHPNSVHRRRAKEQGMRDSWIPQKYKKNKKSSLEKKK